MKKFLKYIFLFPFIVFVALIISFIFAYRWWQINTASVSTNSQTISFIVPRGRSAEEVGQMLFQKGLIRNPLAFKLYVQIFDKSKNINAGEFKLSASLSVPEIIDKLGKGALELWVTVPEGLRKEEIVERFISGLEKVEPNASSFKKEFLLLSTDLEGYLYPDTYLLPREASASAVVKIMTNTFDKRVNQDIKNGIEKSGRSLNQVITMASIIERETKTKQEKFIVSGILWKRLDTPGWLIQADASVQYGVANAKCLNLSAGRQVLNSKCENWWPILTREDMEINSLYNIYKHKTLPPTPIASPGLSSIEAAANPTSSDYWFYIHDPSGVIHYAKTISEHNSNISKYLGK